VELYLHSPVYLHGVRRNKFTFMQGMSVLISLHVYDAQTRVYAVNNGTVHLLSGTFKNQNDLDLSGQLENQILN
jgi:hypothetical protein